LDINGDTRLQRPVWLGRGCCAAAWGGATASGPCFRRPPRPGRPRQRLGPAAPHRSARRAPRPARARRAPARWRRQGRRARGGDRQRRPVLWRRRVHRLRRGTADAGLLRRARDRARTAAHRALGHPDRNLRVHDPRHAALPSRPRARARGARARAVGAEGRGMIALQHVYWLFGLLLLLVAGRSLRDRANPRRLATASFWGLLAIGFLAGERLPLAVVGLGVVAIALLAGLG